MKNRCQQIQELQADQEVKQHFTVCLTTPHLGQSESAVESKANIITVT